MNNFNQKEYQIVILASLLHDIGKFLHRAGDKYRGSHEEASFKFIENHKNKFNNSLYDSDLLKMLVKYHHATKIETSKDGYFKDKDKKEINRIWKLIAVIKRADTYSCAERDKNQQRQRDIDRTKKSLDSIFSVINLGTKNAFKEDNYKYFFQPLNPLKSFPSSIVSEKEDSLRNLITEFENNLPDFSDNKLFKSFNDILNVWLNLLEKYTWAVPSDTRYELSDISLYDHLRSTAAIAACLYKRHFAAIEQIKNMSRADELIFIGGDFSGIQNYIFDITNKGSGGASKRLRARSFFISLFSEVAIHKIVHALELPIVCNIFSAGGKFLLLAPNIIGVADKLKTVKSEIDHEIHETFFSQFSFLFSWEIIKGFKKQFGIKRFFKIADDMFHRLETEKYRKAFNVLLKENANAKTWNENAFKAELLYSSYLGEGDCKICGKGPAVHMNRDEGIREACDLCHRDEEIGQELPKTNYIAFGRGLLKEGDESNKIIILKAKREDKDKKDRYYVELLREPKRNNDHYLVYRINKTTEQFLPFIDKYYANHVPLNDDNQVLPFEEIAERSIWEKEGKKYGSDFLGVLKADVDNLGLIFSKGFEIPRKVEERCSPIQRKTVSRFLTLSRMLELFFSGWIKEIMSEDYKNEIINELINIEGVDKERFEKYLKSEQINFRNIYTVYSGGDDLVLVGPWETMVVFAIYLNERFRKYTCNNEFITLSAGLVFVKPKHPIASAIKAADLILEKSKEEGKDRITFFGTTVKWEKLPELINFFLFMNEKLNDKESNITTSFLHRLIKYHGMAANFLRYGNVESLRYVSYLNYDIARNIIKWDSEGRIVQGKEEYSILQELINKKFDSNSVLYNIPIPLFWILYRNRKTSW